MRLQRAKYARKTRNERARPCLDEDDNDKAEDDDDDDDDDGGCGALIDRVASTAALPMAPRPALRLMCPPARRGASSTRPATAARAELQRALGRLQRGASPLANLPRLQLALHSLDQAPGTEAVRVAVVGLGPAAAPVARTLLKTLLADPLVDEQAWERELDGHDGPWPLVVRVCDPADAQRPLVTEAAGAAALPELHVSSPVLNGLRLEMLLVNAQAPGPAHGGAALPQLQEAVLAPAVAMPSTVAPAATPVHQALIVAHGLLGAAHVASLPLAGAGAAIRAAVHLPGASTAAPGMDTVDVEQADQAIRLFRQSPQHAMQYERLWSASRVPAVLAWLKAAATPSTGDATKPAVRHLVASLLQATRASVDEAAARHPRCLPAPAADNIDLRHGLAQWAQRAHAELQDQLDLAFGGRHWRKLGWWKLFWRVDDVTLLTNDMLSQYFLPTAEKHLVHLAGRIQQSMRGRLPRYPQPVSSRGSETSPKAEEPETIGPGVAAFDAIRPSSSSLLPKWPGHIAFTRRYLQHETNPALQSLAQTLLAHVLTTSGLSTSLAALLYLSSWASTLYEAGAVAALGVVYGLGRLQRKWGAARNFWEAEVREEGRKALKSAEESVKTVLQVAEEDGTSGLTKEELHKARELVVQATDALARLE